MEEAVAKYRNAAVSEQKLRLLACEIKGLNVERALDKLLFHPKKKNAGILRKTLMSAVANAENNHNMDVDNLIVKRICVDRAFMLKRFRARAKGRGSRILKRYSHIMIFVGEA
jgi:large subunit ribosomal protein L22